MMKKIIMEEKKFSVFKNSAGLPPIVARFEADDVWLTQQQLADLYHI